METNSPPPKLLCEAQSGDAEAQYALAAMYGAGEFIKRDDMESAKWYAAAALQGHTEAQRNLGLMYIYGEGVVQNFATGMNWIRLAAVGGSREAMKALGTAYQEGAYGNQEGAYGNKQPRSKLRGILKQRELRITV